MVEVRGGRVIIGDKGLAACGAPIDRNPDDIAHGIAITADENEDMGIAHQRVMVQDVIRRFLDKGNWQQRFSTILQHYVKDLRGRPAVGVVARFIDHFILADMGAGADGYPIRRIDPDEDVIRPASFTLCHAMRDDPAADTQANTVAYFAECVGRSRGIDGVVFDSHSNGHADVIRTHAKVNKVLRKYGQVQVFVLHCAGYRIIVCWTCLINEQVQMQGFRRTTSEDAHCDEHGADRPMDDAIWGDIHRNGPISFDIVFGDGVGSDVI